MTENMCLEIKNLLDEINNGINRFVGVKYNWQIRDELNVYLEREKIIPYINNSYRKLDNIVNDEINKLLIQDNSILPSIDKFINDIVFNYLFENRVNINLSENLKMESFINSIKNLSMLTYENKSINIGIILCRNKDALKKIKNINEFKIINIDKVRIDKLFSKEKPLLKLIDNKNYMLLLDEEFYVVGILRRDNNCKYLDKLFEEMIINSHKKLFKDTIIDELIEINRLYFAENFIETYIQSNEGKSNDLDKHINMIKNKKIIINNNIKNFSNGLMKILQQNKEELSKEKNSDLFNDAIYIVLNNNESIFYSSNLGVICHKNGRWNFRDYTLLYHEIFLAVAGYPQVLLLKRTSIIINDIINKDKYEYKNLLTCREDMMNELNNLIKVVFKLINNILNISIRKTGALFVILNDKEDFEKNKEKYIEVHDTKKIYTKLLEVPTNINICDIDDELFILLSSIDGAVILDNSLNIISYGSMIKTQDIDKSRCKNIYGARTNAAINATKFGTSIKISEDGNIDIYRKVKYRNSSINAVENVLTIN